MLANEQQVIAFFLPEAPTEMLKIFDEVQLDGCQLLRTEIRRVFDYSYNIFVALVCTSYRSIIIVVLYSFSVFCNIHSMYTLSKHVPPGG